MRWHEQYLGKPWAAVPDPPHSFTCGELLRWVYRVHLGVDAVPIAADPDDVRSCIRDIRNIARYGDFYHVNHPWDFDLALMIRGTEPDHVGLYAGGSILHCLRGAGVCLDDAFTLRSLGWRRIDYMRLSGEAGRV